MVASHLNAWFISGYSLWSDANHIAQMTVSKNQFDLEKNSLVLTYELSVLFFPQSVSFENRESSNHGENAKITVKEHWWQTFKESKTGLSLSCDLDVCFLTRERLGSTGDFKGHIELLCDQLIIGLG